MKIVDLKSTIVSVPYAPPGFWMWAWGVQTGYTAVLAEVITDDGYVGVGESPCAHPSAEITKFIIDSAKPFILDEDPFDIEGIMKRVFESGGWHYFSYTGNRALSSIEMSLWDIVGKACGKPLYKLLGGALRKRIPFMAIIRRQKPKDEAQEAVKLKEQGFKTFYIKVGIADFAKDLEEVKLIREAVGYDVELVTDVNQRWSVGSAIRNIKKLEKYDPLYVEQPTLKNDLDGMALIRRKVDVPIAAHESAYTMYEAFNVIKKDAADVLIVDPRYQLISGVKKIAGITEAAGVPLVVQTPNGELGISESAVLHLVASTANFIYDNQTMYWYLADDVISGKRLTFKDGCLYVPEKSGLGVKLDINKVDRYSKYYKEKGVLTGWKR